MDAKKKKRRSKKKFKLVQDGVVFQCNAVKGESFEGKKKETSEQMETSKQMETSEQMEPKLVQDISLKQQYEDVKGEAFEGKKYQQFLVNQEVKEKKTFSTDNEFEYLYPNIDDPNFNIKIAQRKEFNDTQYDGAIKVASEEADKLCNAEFELAPHQQFVRNFLSFNTPYNSLLLYHGLGTGKTCSAISVSEEMRAYLKQIGLAQRIIIVASPNVQDNFKLQLFDERKLNLVDGLWNIRACTGNTYLKEINPMNMTGLTKEKVVTQVKRVINNAYLFMGYTEFGNYISKKSVVQEDSTNKEALMIKKLKRVFNNRLIIIDEVHNIRITDDNKDKRVALNLMKIVTHVDNLRLLLLSATPMYNSYKEIVWLLNLMNTNDKRSLINAKDVFTKDGNFKINDDGQEIGKDLLIQKATGYISFVRGGNPYTFPYRIFPREFSPDHAVLSMNYPRSNLNGREIIQGLEHLDVYGLDIGSYQILGYNYLLDSLKKNERSVVIRGKVVKMPTFENMESFGYTLLSNLLQALNIIYPFPPLVDEEDPSFDPSELIGKNGLNRVMTFKETTQPPARFDYKYRPDIEGKYGRIFTKEHIGKYSSKIKNICENVEKSTGITLIFSQLLPGGLVPIALGLEEMGYRRYGNTKSLLSDPSVKLENAPKYVMITGDKMYSPNNIEEVNASTGDDNKNGERVKVILISMAGSEGLDFKNIRQVHILEPWYNTNRLEQIIGRAVRTCSHKLLPFEERNVMIFLYGTILPDKSEAVDLYVYRLAELKAVQIGRVTRVMKGAAVDCILNHGQVNFTRENMKQKVELALSNGNLLDYEIGDKPYSAMCDYMDTCTFECTPNKKITEADITLDTYDKNFIVMNNDKIIQRIKGLFKEHYFFKKNDLIKHINVVKTYPIIQINAALDQIIGDKNEFIIDRYGRVGYLVNVGDYYLFQPSEIKDEHISMFDRSRPLGYKRKSLKLEIPEQLQEEVIVKQKKEENTKGKENTKKNKDDNIAFIKEMEENYKLASTLQTTSRGENNWYKFCSLTINKLEKEGLSRELLLQFLVAHIVDMCKFEETKTLLNYIYFNNSGLNEFEEKIKSYLDSKILVGKETGFFTQEKDKQKLLIKKETKWALAETEDFTDLKEEIKEIINESVPNLGSVVGFIINFKSDYKVFKTKNMTYKAKRNKGARCDQSKKSDIIKNLNLIVGENKFTKENTKGNHAIELCSYQEFMLRYYSEIKENDNVWFLYPGLAVLVDIENITN